MAENFNFKLVYSDWYFEYNQKKPYGNCIHPEIISYIENIRNNKLNIDYYKILQYDQQKAIKFDHSEILNFYYRNYPNYVVNIEEINDDNFIYIFPLEIKDTLSALSQKNTFTIENKKYEWYLKDILPKQLIKFFQNGKVKILVSIIHDPNYDHVSMRNFELEMNSIGIDGSNIIFLSGSKFEEYYNFYKDSKIKIYNGHLFLQQYPLMMREFPRIGNLGYMCEFVDDTDLDDKYIRKNKFISCNRTMSKPHRMGLAYLAFKYNLLNEGLFSFIQKQNKELIKNNLNVFVDDIDDNLISKIERILPIELDTQFLLENQKTNFGVTNNKKEWYLESYINIVTETFFGTNVFLSEKIFKPISNLQPFIVLGDYKTLAELKNLGFKTFHPFIDESYDEEKNPKKRFQKIELELKKLKNKSIEEIHNWYYSIKDVLIYNRNHLKSYYGYECYTPIFEKIKNDIEKEKIWKLNKKKLL